MSLTGIQIITTASNNLLMLRKVGDKRAPHISNATYIRDSFQETYTGMQMAIP